MVCYGDNDTSDKITKEAPIEKITDSILHTQNMES